MYTTLANGGLYCFTTNDIIDLPHLFQPNSRFATRTRISNFCQDGNASLRRMYMTEWQLAHRRIPKSSFRGSFFGSFFGNSNHRWHVRSTKTTFFLFFGVVVLFDCGQIRQTTDPTLWDRRVSILWVPTLLLVLLLFLPTRWDTTSTCECDTLEKQSNPPFPRRCVKNLEILKTQVPCTRTR